MKKALVILLVIGFWLTCGYYAHGYSLGYFTHQFPWSKHEPWCTVWGYTGGPFALAASLIEGGNRYWRTKPLSTEERWNYFHSKWENLSMEEFEREEN
jgi:hypothetical protein